MSEATEGADRAPGAAADFTHDSAGTPASAWRSAPEWSALTVIDDLAAYERIIVVAAHPDDETLGAAGLCARAAASGVPVEVVLVTSGEHSHPLSTTHSSGELGDLRRHESRLALDVVAPGAELRHLGLEDGTVADHEELVATSVVDLVGNGGSTLLVAPWRHDGHPDHDAAGRAAAAAAHRTDARLLEYPVWAWHWSDPADLPWADVRCLPLSEDERALKATALACHATQVEPLSDETGDEVLLHPAFLAHFAHEREIFLQQRPADSALDDLHRTHVEPWHVDERWYERRKRDVTLAMLPRERFRRGLEIGGSTGALAARLAERCESLTVVDASPAAAQRTEARFATDPHVQTLLTTVPQEWPPGEFDLVVMSETGYFLSPKDLEGLRARIGGCLSVDGVVVLCHWKHPIVGWPLDGPAVHDHLLGGLGLTVVARYSDRDVELLVLGPDDALPTADQ